MGRVQDKVAIITGGASGVGRADALLLAREGAKVVVTDLNEKDGAAVAAEINGSGGTARFMKHDISSNGDWERVIAETAGTFGGLDILVNNAAILLYGTIEDQSYEDWQKIQRINSDGYFLGCKHAYAAMKARGGGSIVNMSSISGIGGISSYCAYSASKGAVTALTKSIAAHARFHHHKIRCNSIHPDGIATPMVFGLRQSMPKGKQSQVRDSDAQRLLQRMAQPEEIANVVLFLASDESGRLNGAELRVDGGYLMWSD